MKKKHILYSIATLLLLSFVAAAIWYFSPKVFLKGIDSSDIASIYVSNGSQGKNFAIESHEDIDTIASSIQSLKMKRGKISSNYDGFAFCLTFIDKDGNVIDSFIVNSKIEIRDDPFFYECKEGEVCFDYLVELASK